MDQKCLTYGITVLANALAGELSNNELAVAAAFFTQLGDTLATISAMRQSCTDS